MKQSKTGYQSHPFVYYVVQIFNKLRQSPETYPIKYYKKGRPLRKGIKTPIIL